MVRLWMFPTSFVLAALLFLLVPPIQRRISLARASKRYGCATPPRLPAKDKIWGIDTVMNILQSTKEHRRLKTMYSHYEKLGKTFESWPFGRRVVSTIDARNIQFVLSAEHEKFGVGPVRELAQSPMTGKGIITSDGDVWRQGRAMIRPTFTRSNIADMEMFGKHVDRLFNLLPKTEEAVDLLPLLHRLVRSRME